MIIQKKDSPQANIFIDYLKSISGLNNSPERLLYARKKLDAVENVRQLIKDNSPDEEEKKQMDSALNSFSEKKESSTPQVSFLAPIGSKASNSDEKGNLKRYLDEMAANRKANELVYGYKKKSDSEQINKRWGVEVAETPGFYKKNLDSTITRGAGGWAEFGITYDNKVFLSPSSVDKQNSFEFNHQTMGGGTFLKAAGMLKVENGKLIIAPYSQSLVLGLDYLPIILFVLQKKGYSISPENTVIEDETGEPISHDSVNYYLDEMRFPSAKAIAENEELSMKARLSELFLSIDDEILAVKNPQVIKTLTPTRAVLQADMINFLLLLIDANLQDEEKAPQQQKQAEDKLADNSQATLFQYYEKIMAHIRVFQAEKIDIRFVTTELVAWFYYLYGFKKRNNVALTSLQEIETHLKEIKQNSIVLPQRFVGEFDGANYAFLKFYTENPLKTCIALLRDYTKGGVWGRFFSGAWQRHHVKPVGEFLKKYDSGQFADDLSIQAIYQALFGVESSLEEHVDKQGTLFKRLLFCAELANEIPSKSAERELVTIPQQTTNFEPPLPQPIPIDRASASVSTP